MTEPIVSTFKEKPKTKTGWWTLWLGISALLVIPVLAFSATLVRRLLDPVSFKEMPPGIVAGPAFNAFLVSFTLSILAVVTGIRAIKSGERSWAIWVGLLPAIVMASFWLMMVVGELLFPH
jgi:hypothetical protein